MTNTYSAKKAPIRSLFIMTAAFLSVFAATAFAWNFTVPAQEIKPINGVFEFPESMFADGKAKHFVYKHSPTEWIRFFAVKSTDGVVRAAFDACDVCYKSKKGYVQQGNDMVCMNCGMKFRTDKINEVKGGCNPAPLQRSVNGGKLTISQQDMLNGFRYFK